MGYEVVRVGKLGRGNYLLVRGVQPAVTYVLAYRTREQVRILQYHAERASQRHLAYLLYGYTVIDYLALLNVIEAVYKVGYGGLARACGADERYLLPGLGVKGNIVEHVHLPIVAEGNVVKAHVPAHPCKGAVRPLPCPYARALRALLKPAVLGNAGVYHGYFALVRLGRLVKQGEYPLGSCKGAQHIVGLLAYLCYRHGKAPCVLQKRAQRAYVYYASNAEQAAAGRYYGVCNVGKVVHYRPHYAAQGARRGGVPPKLLVKLVKAGVYGLLMAEYLYHLLPLYHLLDIAVHLAHAFLPGLEEAARVFCYQLCYKAHQHQHNYAYSREYGV